MVDDCYKFPLILHNCFLLFFPHNNNLTDIVYELQAKRDPYRFRFPIEMRFVQPNIDHLMFVLHLLFYVLEESLNLCSNCSFCLMLMRAFCWIHLG
jgi:hypothetical protein